MKADYDLAALAAVQAGYLGLDQIEQRGLSESAIKWRVQSGAWIPIRKGLYRVNGVHGDYKGLVRGAMAILPDPTVSHESAAEVHAIPHIARSRAVVSVHASTTHDFPGVRIHRSLDMASDHRQVIDSLWTTTPARTLVDSAAVLHPKALALAVDDALARKLVSIEELQRVFDQVARRGRTGCGAMRKLLEERVGAEMLDLKR